MSPPSVRRLVPAPSLGAIAGFRQRLVTGLRDLMYPPVCTLCGAETMTPDTLCPECWGAVAFLDGPGCRTCGYPIEAGLFGTNDLICDNCVRVPKRWDRGCAVFRYQGSGRALILGLKHADRFDRVPMLATWAIRAAGPLLEAPGVLVPVPLHWRRRLKRRGNQAAELARAIGRRSGLVHAPRALVRNRFTGSQDGKNNAGRVDNVSDAFSAGPEQAALAGARVVLVDDVMTTGATLNEAARMCLSLGAASVDVVVLALVVRDESAYIGAEMEDDHDDS